LITELINSSLSYLTLLGQIILLVVLVMFLNKKNLSFLKKNVILFAFIVALIATTGSLFYSEILGYTPCKLCWLQRIFMYPLVLLFGISLFKKDNNIIPYGLGMSLVGAIIAIYHYLLQIGFVSGMSCGVVGHSAECSKRFVMDLGYITIPMMAFTAFLLIFLFLYLKRK